MIRVYSRLSLIANRYVAWCYFSVIVSVSLNRSIKKLSFGWDKSNGLRVRGGRKGEGRGW